MSETFADPHVLVDPLAEFFADQGEAAAQQPSHERTHPSVVKVGVALAAALLVGRKLMQAGLEGEPAPDTSGAAAALARQVWKKAAPAWLQITVPALQRAYELGANRVTYAELEPFAAAHAQALGDYLAETSAEALAEGFAAQLNAGWHPTTAWTRASYAWGLDKQQMKSYVMGLLKGDREAYATDPVPLAARAAVDRLMLARADRLGLTEAFKANQLGKGLSWLILEQTGQLPPGAMKKWVTAGDERVCGVCGGLDGQTVPLKAKFETPGGERFFAPGTHPNCRCWLELVYPDLGDDIVKNVPGDPYDRDRKGQFARKEERATKPKVTFKERPAPLDPALAALLRQAAARTEEPEPIFDAGPGWADLDPGWAEEPAGGPGFAAEDPGFADEGPGFGGGKPPVEHHHFFVRGNGSGSGGSGGTPEHFHMERAIYYADPWLLHAFKGEYPSIKTGDTFTFDSVAAYADESGVKGASDPAYEAVQEAFAGYLAGWTRARGSADTGDVDEVVFGNENYMDIRDEENIAHLPRAALEDVLRSVIRANGGKEPKMPWTMQQVEAGHVDDVDLALFIANAVADENHGLHGDGPAPWQPFTQALTNAWRDWGLSDADAAVAAMEADTTASQNEPTMFEFTSWHGTQREFGEAQLTGSYEVVATWLRKPLPTEVQELRDRYSGNFEAQEAINDFARTGIRIVQMAPLPAPRDAVDPVNIIKREYARDTAGRFAFTNELHRAAKQLNREPTRTAFPDLGLSGSDFRGVHLGRPGMVLRQLTDRRKIDRALKTPTKAARAWSNSDRFVAAVRAKDPGLPSVMAEMVRSAPANAPKLYRGMAIPRDEAAKWKKGAQLDLAFTSWTASPRATDYFVARAKKRGQGTVPVRLEMQSGGKALNISPLARHRLAEWVSTGRATVTSRRFKDGVLVITVRHNSVR